MNSKYTNICVFDQYQNTFCNVSKIAVDINIAIQQKKPFNEKCGYHLVNNTTFFTNMFILNNTYCNQACFHTVYLNYSIRYALWPKLYVLLYNDKMFIIHQNFRCKYSRNGLLLLLQVIILKCVIRKEMFCYPHAIITHIKAMLI